MKHRKGEGDDMKTKYLLFNFSLTISLATAATLAHAQTALPVSEIGHSTRELLSLQVSGKVAAPAQPMLGAEAGAAYARYLKSFDTPIPAHYGSTVGDTSGSGSGGSGSGSGGQY
jgi:hypothetical protein